MYLNNILRCCLWLLPWRIPFGKCHYATGCELALLSDFMCIEKCLTNVSCNGICNDTCSPFKRK